MVALLKQMFACFFEVLFVAGDLAAIGVETTVSSLNGTSLLQTTASPAVGTLVFIWK